jgi:cytosine deaminase
LIVFNARTLNEVVSRHHADRVVIDGRRSEARVPDYSELWDNTLISGQPA